MTTYANIPSYTSMEIFIQQTTVVRQWLHKELGKVIIYFGTQFLPQKDIFTIGNLRFSCFSYILYFMLLLIRTVYSCKVQTPCRMYIILALIIFSRVQWVSSFPSGLIDSLFMDPLIYICWNIIRRDYTLL